MSRTPDTLEQTPHDGLPTLERNECLTRLADRYVGELGYVDGDRPVIVPVNYRVDADGAVLFLTGEGLKLDAARAGRTLCLAVQEVDALSKSGWSVLLTGKASLIDPELASAEASLLLLRPWARDVPRPHLVRISPDRVEGRRLGRTQTP